MKPTILEMRKEQIGMKDELCEILVIISELASSMKRLKHYKATRRDPLKNPHITTTKIKSEDHTGLAYLQTLIDDEANNSTEVPKVESIESDIEIDEFIEIERYLEEGFSNTDIDPAKSFESIEHQLEDDPVSKNQQVIVLSTTPFGPKTKIVGRTDHKQISSDFMDTEEGIEPKTSVGSENFDTIPSLSSNSLSQIEALTDPDRLYIQVNEAGIEEVKQCPQFPKVRLDSAEHTVVPPDYCCSLCGLPFDKEQDLIDHMIDHSRGSITKCFSCTFQTTNEKDMKQHLKSHEIPSKPKKVKKDKNFYKCVKCSFQTTYVNRMHTHVDLHFEKISEKCYECQICKKRYKEHASLRKHRMGHAGVRPFVCKICGANFFLKAYLNIHIRYSHRDKPFKCTYCSYRFSQKSTLVLHVRTHTGEKPYKCDQCAYRAIGSKTLLEHQRNKHTERKPFKCSICGKGFHVQSRLDKHIKLHTVNEIDDMSADEGEPLHQILCTNANSDTADFSSIDVAFTSIIS